MATALDLSGRRFVFDCPSGFGPRQLSEMATEMVPTSSALALGRHGHHLQMKGRQQQRPPPGGGGAVQGFGRALLRQAIRVEGQKLPSNKGCCDGKPEAGHYRHRLRDLASVRMAFEHWACSPRSPARPVDIEQADKLILPGVGTAVAAMKNLNERGLVPIFAPPRQPLLGFCLGMQMLAQASEESMKQRIRGCGGSTASAWCQAGSGLMGGQSAPAHMGWNQITRRNPPAAQGDPRRQLLLLHVHSYALDLTEATLAICDYGRPALPPSWAATISFGAQFPRNVRCSRLRRLLQNFPGAVTGMIISRH